MIFFIIPTTNKKTDNFQSIKSTFVQGFIEILFCNFSFRPNPRSGHPWCLHQSEPSCNHTGLFVIVKGVWTVDLGFGLSDQFQHSSLTSFYLLGNVWIMSIPEYQFTLLRKSIFETTTEWIVIGPMSTKIIKIAKNFQIFINFKHQVLEHWWESFKCLLLLWKCHQKFLH